MSALLKFANNLVRIFIVELPECAGKAASETGEDGYWTEFIVGVDERQNIRLQQVAQ